MARLCRLRRRADFAGYGFSLVAMSGGRRAYGHYVRDVEPGSPAAAAALTVGDRILEVNGTSVDNDTHQQVTATALYVIYT